jgi:hypothetical protein
MSAHLKSQLGRFARVFAAVFLPQLVAFGTSGQHLTVSAVIALIPAAFEVAYRQFAKTIPAK